MTKDKDDKTRPHLRLVVNNAEKRSSRPADGEDEIISLAELVANRDTLRREFYGEMAPQQAKTYEVLEKHLADKGWPYGLDPRHGQLLVLPAGIVCPEMTDPGGDSQDELLVYVAEDLTGHGLCLSMEILLPYYSEDEAVMEDVFLYAPVHQYGTLFLEENQRDGLLDLIYRLSFPLFPPALTGKVLERLFAIVAFELRATLQNLAE